MKTLKFMGLILAMLIVNSCADKKIEDEIEREVEIPPLVFLSGENWPLGVPFYPQELVLSFQDSSGNDLVKGMGFSPVDEWRWNTGTFHTEREKIPSGIVKSELYTLEYVCGESDFVFSSHYYPMGLRKGKSFSKKYSELNSNYDYLYCQTAAYNIETERIFDGKITYRLTCPYLFGDDAVHDIDTWWKPGEQTGSSLCYRIEFGGKEFTEITYIYDALYSRVGLSTYSLATIVWDR